MNNPKKAGKTMKIGIMFSSLLLIMTVISGCGDGSSPNKKVSLEKNTVNENEKIMNHTNESTAKETQEVLLDHLKIKVSSQWGVNKGIDSAAFSIKDKSVGIIEGLAYADSLEAVLPNQSIVTDKQKLTQLPFDAYKVTTSSDAVKSKTKTETHIYMFIEPKKAVYDLHFETNLVDEATILQIVQSAEIVHTD
jgi:hypothetical protein